MTKIPETKNYQVAHWLKKNFFQTPFSSLLSLIILSLVFKLLTFFNDWLFFKSVWKGDAQTCHESQGACLTFLKEKIRFIFWGPYPYSQHWRPCLAVFIFLIGLIFLLAQRENWKSYKKSYFFLFLFLFITPFFLMYGGEWIFLKKVEVAQWGGLPLTLILSTIGILFSYPLGILLALGRTSRFPFIRSFSILYIELIRGVPLISVLFIFSVLFPLFLPQGIELQSKYLRAQLAIILFMAAYMAEVVRGGLSSVGEVQYEAAKSLGLNSFQALRYIILPQALKTAIPPTVNTAIGMFKDTSLVFILSLFDFLGTGKASLKDPNWQGFSVEVYFFLALIYFIFCFSMGQYSKKLEGYFHE